MDVHEAHYQQTEDLIERVEMSKVLLIQDLGRVGEFQNKSLKDIQLTGCTNFMLCPKIPFNFNDDCVILSISFNLLWVCDSLRS